MGLFNKLKNLFFEEPVEDDKVENYQDETTDYQEKKPINEVQSKKDDEIDNIISERELFKSETTFKFPVMFEDEDFLAAKEAAPVTNILDFESKNINKAENERKEKPIFRVSPIISPVYGILDKNYKKEDIITKEKQSEVPRKKENPIDFDVVRKKAYGSLSEDLKDMINQDDNDTMFFNLKSNDNQKPVEEDNLLYDMSQKGEDLIMEDIMLENVEANCIDLGLETPDDKKKVTTADEDNLFELIDSMYEEE